jgi:hypothetical protein
MNLKRLYDTLVRKKVIATSRVKPIKSSLKHYALALGYADLASCPVSAYLLPSKNYKQLIKDTSSRLNKSNDGYETLSARTIINIKHDVGFILREGVNLRLIAGRYEPPNQLNATAAAPSYKRTASQKEFLRGDSKHLPSIAILEKDLPMLLRTELDVYYTWTTGEFVSNRPRRNKKRPITADCNRNALRRVAGFQITYCGAVAHQLSLASLTDCASLEKYINWFIRHHERATHTLKMIMTALISLAGYLTITASTEKKRDAMVKTLRQLKEMRDRIPAFVTVRDKSKCWLSLEQIEMCGINRYPRNSTRLAVASDTVRWKLRTLNPTCWHPLKYTAIYAFSSLLVRLMIRVPLRIRNFMEMSWNPHRPEEGKNLFRQDGSWYIRFSGNELKVGSRKGKINSILHRFPSELTWLLEEVLTIWRPIITGVPYHLPQGDEAATWSYTEPPQTKAPEYKKAPQDVLLFLNSKGMPTVSDNIRTWVKSTTYIYTKVAVNPHLIRDIWATTYIKATGDFIGAAKRLGDTVETVMKHYAHLLDDDAEAKGDAFNQTIFGGNVG